MLNSLTLLRAMNGIHEEDVVMAENSYFEKTVKHFKTKRIVTFALAAVLILAMSVTAYAAWKYLSARDVAYRQTVRSSPVVFMIFLFLVLCRARRYPTD